MLFRSSHPALSSRQNSQTTDCRPPSWCRPRPPLCSVPRLREPPRRIKPPRPPCDRGGQGALTSPKLSKHPRPGLTPRPLTDTWNYVGLPWAHCPHSLTHSFKGDVAQWTVQDLVQASWLEISHQLSRLKSHPPGHCYTDCPGQLDQEGTMVWGCGAGGWARMRAKCQGQACQPEGRETAWTPLGPRKDNLAVFLCHFMDKHVNSATSPSDTQSTFLHLLLPRIGPPFLGGGVSFYLSPCPLYTEVPQSLARCPWLSPARCPPSKSTHGNSG